MSADGASVDLGLDEERHLFEMANLYPRTTGPPVTVLVRPRGGARHGVRIEVCRTPGDRMDLEDLAIVAVRPAPAVIHGELKPEIARPVLAWTAANADALIDYWDGRIGTIELDGRLKPYAA
jgi:hypothetical protein